MLSVLLIQMLLWSLWSNRTSAIFSLTASPVFTMEPPNATEKEELKQAFTVALDLDPGTTVTDPVTDGGTQISSQPTAITSKVAPALDNVMDVVENNITPQEPGQPTSLLVFSMNLTESSPSAVDKVPQDNENKSNLVPVHDPHKAYPFDEQPLSYSEIPMEIGPEEKEFFSNMSEPGGQKGDKGDKGDQGDPGPQGLKGTKGKNGVKGEAGSKGDKGEMGAPGIKGDPGVICAACEKGVKGDQGIPGNEGPMGLQGNKGETGDKGTKGKIGPKGEPGTKGSKGTDGIPGTPGLHGPMGLIGQRGPVGSKGERGLPGATGPQGYRGPAGIPGRKGEKGQKGSSSERDNIAFSVAFRGNRNTLLPAQPLRFDRVFVNENKPYNVNSGVFVATVEGVYFFSYHLNPSISCLIAGLAHNSRIVVQTKMQECDVCQSSGSVLLHLLEDDEVWLQVINGGQKELSFDDSDSLFSGFMLYSFED
ncbi:uncharacterized protein PAF06_007090 [Gastrophryne carolinensis]